MTRPLSAGGSGWRTCPFTIVRASTGVVVTPTAPALSARSVTLLVLPPTCSLLIDEYAKVVGYDFAATLAAQLFPELPRPATPAQVIAALRARGKNDEPFLRLCRKVAEIIKEQLHREQERIQTSLIRVDALNGTKDRKRRTA